MPDRPDIPEELVEKAGHVLETCEEERFKALLHARPGEPSYPIDRRIDARKALEAVADQLRNQGAEGERERLRGEDRRLAAFEKLTEGNFFRFTDPEHQEEYVWQIVDAVLDAALDTPAPSEPEEDK